MRVYISTYGLYNAGFLSGRWFDAIELDDSDAILSEIRLLAAKNGANPDDVGDELMIQDSEDFPVEVGECSNLSELYEIANDCESDSSLLERVELAREAHGLHGMSWGEIKSLCEDMMVVSGDSIEDAAAELVEQTGLLEGVSQTLRNYFDYVSYARDLTHDGWTSVRMGGTSYLVFIQ